MKLIVGLGNPGAEYLMTRHNIGFMVVDALAQRASDTHFRQEKKAQVAKVRMGSEPILLAKPQTFMNLSGESVRAITDYYSVGLDELLVIHDDIDQPYLGIRFQTSRGHGGHNGIRSITQHLGSKDYARLKLGVGRPSHPKADVADYVLNPFSKAEQEELPEFLSTACDAVECFVQEGMQKAATKFNRAGERK